jgi:hypothetical protein
LIITSDREDEQRTKQLEQDIAEKKRRRQALRAGLGLRARSNRSSPVATPTLAADVFVDNPIVSNLNFEQSASRLQDHCSDASSLTSPVLPSLPSMSPISFNATLNHTQDPPAIDEAIDLKDTTNGTGLSRDGLDKVSALKTVNADAVATDTIAQSTEQEFVACPKTPELLQQELVPTGQNSTANDSSLIQSPTNFQESSEEINTFQNEPTTDELAINKDERSIIQQPTVSKELATSKDFSVAAETKELSGQCLSEPTNDNLNATTDDKLVDANEDLIQITNNFVDTDTELSLKPLFEKTTDKTVNLVIENEKQQKKTLETIAPEIQKVSTESLKAEPGSQPRLLKPDVTLVHPDEFEDLSPNTSFAGLESESQSIDITDNQILSLDIGQSESQSGKEKNSRQLEEHIFDKSTTSAPAFQQTTQIDSSAMETLELERSLSPKSINRSPSPPKSPQGRYSVSTPRTPHRSDITKFSPKPVLPLPVPSPSPKGSFLATRQQTAFPFKTSASVTDLQESNFPPTTSSPFLSARSPSSISRSRAGRVGFVQSAILRSRAGSIDSGDASPNSLLARSISRASQSSSPTKRIGHARAQSTNSIIYNSPFTGFPGSGSAETGSPRLNNRVSHLNLHSSAIARFDSNERSTEIPSNALRKKSSRPEVTNQNDNEVLSYAVDISPNVGNDKADMLKEAVDPKDIIEGPAKVDVKTPEPVEVSQFQNDKFIDSSEAIDNEFVDDDEPDFAPRKIIHIHHSEKTAPDTDKPDQTQVAKSAGAVEDEVIEPKIEKETTVTRKSSESIILDSPTLGAKFELRPASPTKGLLASPFRSNVQLSPEASPTRGSESPKASPMPRWGGRGRSTWLESALMKNPASPGLDRSQSALQRSPTGKSTANFPRGKVPLPAPLTYNRPSSPTKMLGNIRNFAGDLDRSPSRVGRASEPDIRLFLPDRPSSPTKSRENFTSKSSEKTVPVTLTSSRHKEVPSVESSLPRPAKKSSDSLKSSISLKARVVSPSTALILDRSNSLRPVPTKKQDKTPVPEAFEKLRQLRSSPHNKYHPSREGANATAPDWKSNLKRSSTVQHETTDTMKETILGVRNSLRPSSSLSVHSTEVFPNNNLDSDFGGSEKTKQSQDSAGASETQKPLALFKSNIPVASSKRQSLPKKQTVAEAASVNAPEIEREEEVVVSSSDRESTESDLEEERRDSGIEEIGSVSPASYNNMSSSEQDLSANGEYDDDYYLRSLTPPLNHAIRDEIEISDSEDEGTEIIYTPPRSIPKPIRGGGQTIPTVRGLNDEV